MMENILSKNVKVEDFYSEYSYNCSKWNGNK